MGPVSGVVSYTCIWWVVLFCTLSIGVNPHDDQNTGTAGSAPDRPNLKFKFILTSIVAAGVWLVILMVIQSGIINLFDLAEDMYQEAYM